MPKQTIYNAGIYVRLSKDDERAGESLSIENQKRILTSYVTEQGWNLIDIYVDDGYSGTNFNRPGVTRLLEDARACSHKGNVRIFEHNFNADKAKIRRQADACQGFLTLNALKFAKKTCVYVYVNTL